MVPDQDGIAFGKEEPLLRHAYVPEERRSQRLDSYILWKLAWMFSTRTNQKESAAAVAFLDSRVLRMGRAEGRRPSAFLIIPQDWGNKGVDESDGGHSPPL